MQLLYTAKEFLRHRGGAGNMHGIHSPFVYDLYTNVIRDGNSYYSFEKIEALRARMLLSQEKIPVHDFGTGGEEKRQRLISLSSIASHYVKPKKEAQLLFRLVNYFHPHHILELGTSLGITTLYLAAPSKKSQIVTLEGCPNTAAAAAKNFELAGAKNIRQITGEFGKTLPEAIEELQQLDFVYFDGNHEKKATLEYFNLCMRRAHHGSVFVFDDIYWSKGMTDAWNEIREHPSISISIDLFSMGIAIFRDTLKKQHFRLQF